MTAVIGTPFVPSTTDPKIIDLINNHTSEKPWVAFEYFPPRTKSGLDNLRARFPRMQLEGQPLYADMTWGAGGTTSEASMDLAITMRKDCNMPTNLHLTCTNMEVSKITEALQTAKDAGIRNICALRGDPPEGQTSWESTEGGLSCALDLVQHIRSNFGDYFCVSVAGYPEGHPTKIKVVEGGLDALSESEKTRCSVVHNKDGTDTVYVCNDADFSDELDYLKKKVDAGSDFILTQMFFDVDTYAAFVTACREKGITVPIVPGIMCLNSYPGFKKMVEFCKTRVPDALFDMMEKVKDNKDDVKNFGIEFGAEMSRKLLLCGAPGLHYYSLNLALVVLGIVKELKIDNQDVDPKICDLISEYSEKKPWVAFEFFPPRTESGIVNLNSRFDRMRMEGRPLYADITWGAGGTTSEATLGIATSLREHGLIPNMHLTCTNIEVDSITSALIRAKGAGIRNICALRGDPPEGQTSWESTEGGLSCALDLVQHIRSKFGDYFSVCVAGYPEGHPTKIKVVEGGLDALSESEKTRCSVVHNKDGTDTVYVCNDADFSDELDYLKKKVDAGSDFILTQMFFDVDTYAAFVTACREKGITVPIVPGIMCLNSYPGFKKMVEFCKTRVPDALFDMMEKVKDNKDDVKNFGIEFGAEMSRKLLACGAPGLHYYTLNLEVVTMGILEKLELKHSAPAPPPHKVTDMCLAGYGSDEMELAAKEMPGLMQLRAQYKYSLPFKNMRISGTSHITAQAAVMIETLSLLGAEVRWCSCNIFSTQDHATAAIVSKHIASVFAWKDESLTDYWESILNALCWEEDDGEGKGPDMIMDNGGDMTLLLHQGYLAEQVFLKDGTLPTDVTEEDASADNTKRNRIETRIINKLIKDKLSEDNTFWSKTIKRIRGVSEDTAVGVYRLLELEKSSQLLLPCINLRTTIIDQIEKNFCYLHALPQALQLATSQTLCGKKALICGFGDLGQAAATALKAAGCLITVLDTSNNSVVSPPGYTLIKTLSEDILGSVDIFITTINEDKVLSFDILSQLKQSTCIVASLDNANYEDEPDYVKKLNECAVREALKPHVSKYTLVSETATTELILIAQGRLLSLCHGLGNASFVKSYYFTNQVLAQIELLSNKKQYASNKTHSLPDALLTKVRESHFGAF